MGDIVFLHRWPYRWRRFIILKRNDCPHQRSSRSDETIRSCLFFVEYWFWVFSPWKTDVIRRTSDICEKKSVTVLGQKIGLYKLKGKRLGLVRVLSSKGNLLFFVQIFHYRPGNTLFSNKKDFSRSYYHSILYNLYSLYSPVLSLSVIVTEFYNWLNNKDKKKYYHSSMILFLLFIIIIYYCYLLSYLIFIFF